MAELESAEQLTPLQRKLRDKALAGVDALRSQTLEPLIAILHSRDATYTLTLDATTDQQIARAVQGMLPSWGGMPVTHGVLPEDEAGILERLMELKTANEDVFLWFEAFVPSHSALLNATDCYYGVFSGRFGDLSPLAAHLKAIQGSPLGSRRLALVATDFQWMIWVEGRDAVLCTPAPPNASY